MMPFPTKRATTTAPPVYGVNPVENAKWGHLILPYLKGNGIELATGGAPISPTSIQFELTPATYTRYNGGNTLRGPVQWRDDRAIFRLPFMDRTLDYVASSHLLEDFLDWMPLLVEWVRVLKTGGKLVICLPDKERWNKAIANGQTPNCAHKHEAFVGELSLYMPKLGMKPLIDRLTDTPPGDYNILHVSERL